MVKVNEFSCRELPLPYCTIQIHILAKNNIFETNLFSVRRSIRLRERVVAK